MVAWFGFDGVSGFLSEVRWDRAGGQGTFGALRAVPPRKGGPKTRNRGGQCKRGVVVKRNE